jgi:hypothetical protein
MRALIKPINSQGQVGVSISQRIALTGISWQQFKLVQSGLRDTDGTRLFYNRGVLEILSTSLEHELIKGLIGALLEFSSWKWI